MKKIWVSISILFLIFSLISCGNGKNKTSKEIKTIKIENQIAQNFKIEPYPWVSRKPIKRVSNPEKTSGTWEFAARKIEEISIGNSEKEIKNKEICEQPILYVEVLYINTNNMEKESVILGFPVISKEKLFVKEDYLEFDYNPRGQSHSNEFYNTNGELKKNKIQGIIDIYKGDSPFEEAYGNFVQNIYYRALCLCHKKGFKEIMPDCGSYGSKYYKVHKTPKTINSKEFLSYSYDYYKVHDLHIDDIDIYGNIKGKYGKQKFTIPPGDSWQSKLTKQSIPCKYFKYDWPEYKDGNWVYKKDTIIRITGKKQIMEMRGKYKTWVQDFEIICELKNPDKYLLKKSGSGTSIPSYSKDEILEIINHIKQKYPDIEINGMDRDWEWYSITKIDYEGKLKKYLPIMGNPKFVTQIRIINHGWMVYYY